MAHKVHPKLFRTRKTADWHSRWFEKKGYRQALREDFLIRSHVEKKLKDAFVERVEIERVAGKVFIFINTARPGLIIGRGGSGIEELRKGLERFFPGRRDVNIEIREMKNPWVSAALSAQWVAQQLERRMPYRRVLKQAVTKIMANKEVRGVKVEIAGRLGGADIARRETLKEGRLPLQTLRADIDYALEEAKTTYGMIGVKVWLYKGEQFE